MEDFHAPRVSADGKVVLQYARHGHTRDVDARRSTRQQQLIQSRHHSEAGTAHLDLDAGRIGKHGRRSKSRPRVQLPVEKSSTVSHNFVSVYFTNIPQNITYRSLREGFEVCGIMEDVYLARKRNMNGGVFGFVRYSKVRDVDKLLKAVNNVRFGDWKVVAKVASFDRFGNARNVVQVNGEGEKIDRGLKKYEGEKKLKREQRVTRGRELR